MCVCVSVYEWEGVCVCVQVFFFWFHPFNRPAPSPTPFFCRMGGGEGAEYGVDGEGLTGECGVGSANSI